MCELENRSLQTEEDFRLSWVLHIKWNDNHRHRRLFLPIWAERLFSPQNPGINFTALRHLKDWRRKATLNGGIERKNVLNKIVQNESLETKTKKKNSSIKNGKSFKSEIGQFLHTIFLWNFRLFRNLYFRTSLWFRRACNKCITTTTTTTGAF